ncbi:MAG TPA: restriction endonuclease [Polyangiaceae bacterium]|nr:restriction endonuclease [Polyangiaceae bacterium]
MGLGRLVEAAQRKGRLSGESSHAQAMIGAAARADNLRRSARGQRPRFRLNGSRIALTEWSTDPELLRLERDLESLLERYREVARRALLRHLQELPQRAFGELVLLALSALDFHDLSVVRRPGAHGAELHLSGKSRQAAGDIPCAIIVRRDGREIGRERVTELRGSLHHYGPAAAGCLVTAGQVLSGAREEAAAPGAAPVSLIDGLALARICEQRGVAVTETKWTLPFPDLELLDQLRAGG